MTERRRDPAVVIQALRALSALGDPASVPVLTKLVTDRAITGPLRQEAMAALAALIDARGIDLLLDLLTDPVPAVRAACSPRWPGSNRRPSCRCSRAWKRTRTGQYALRSPRRSVRCRTEQGVARLTVRLQDRDRGSSRRCSMPSSPSKAAGMDKVLLERLKSDDFVIRAAAANGLAEIKAEGAAQALTEAYRASLLAT